MQNIECKNNFSQKENVLKMVTVGVLTKGTGDYNGESS